MEKKILACASLLFFGMAGAAYGACTAEDVLAKQQEFMNTAVSFAQSNPEKYQEVTAILQKELPGLQQINDLDKLCEFYDEMTKKMQ
jgi:alanine-alpha-ketoisovalerate/valine-pyruvate aminotransferase